MFEKVNPMHPDKIADRIAGAIIDLSYEKDKNPKIACEVLIGHGECNVILESSVKFDNDEIKKIVDRISKTSNIKLNLLQNNQDPILANNQIELSCGDNGIFKGCPTTDEQKELSNIAKNIYDHYKEDGKYIYDKENSNLIICQSNALDNFIIDKYKNYNLTLNPLGNWTGGLDVDSGATNRKLGSDLGDAVTGGGIHGKDLSKSDVSINIYCHIIANETNNIVTALCAIGDKEIMFNFYENNHESKLIKNQKIKYDTIVSEAKKFITNIGGFEKLAEWGLIR